MAKDFQSQTVVDGYDQHIRKLIPGYELVHLQIQAILLSYDLMSSSNDSELKVLQTLCQSNGLTVVQSEKMIERLQQDFYLISSSQMLELLTKVGFHEVRTYSQLLNYYGFFAKK